MGLRGSKGGNSLSISATRESILLTMDKKEQSCLVADSGSSIDAVGLFFLLQDMRLPHPNGFLHARFSSMRGEVISRRKKRL